MTQYSKPRIVKVAGKWEVRSNYVSTPRDTAFLYHAITWCMRMNAKKARHV